MMIEPQFYIGGQNVDSSCWNVFLRYQKKTFPTLAMGHFTEELGKDMIDKIFDEIHRIEEIDSPIAVRVTYIVPNSMRMECFAQTHQIIRFARTMALDYDIVIAMRVKL